MAGALDLALVGPHLTLRQGVVLVAALVVDRMERVVAAADQRDATTVHVEAPRLARCQLVGRAERHGLRHRRSPAGHRAP